MVMFSKFKFLLAQRQLTKHAHGTSNSHKLLLTDGLCWGVADVCCRAAQPTGVGWGNRTMSTMRQNRRMMQQKDWVCARPQTNQKSYSRTTIKSFLNWNIPLYRDNYSKKIKRTLSPFMTQGHVSGQKQGQELQDGCVCGQILCHCTTQTADEKRVSLSRSIRDTAGAPGLREDAPMWKRETWKEVRKYNVCPLSSWTNSKSHTEVWLEREN